MTIKVNADVEEIQKALEAGGTPYNPFDHIRRLEFCSQYSDAVNKWHARAVHFNKLPLLKSTWGEVNHYLHDVYANPLKPLWVRRHTSIVPVMWRLPEPHVFEKDVERLLFAIDFLDKACPIQGFLLHVGLFSFVGGDADQRRANILLSYPHVSIHQNEEAQKLVLGASEMLGYTQVVEGQAL
jgi:hypothetical protein